MEKRCEICNHSTPRVPIGRVSHQPCADAEDLGYDPISESDALKFLSRQEKKEPAPADLHCAIRRRLRKVAYK